MRYRVLKQLSENSDAPDWRDDDLFVEGDSYEECRVKALELTRDAFEFRLDEEYQGIAPITDLAILDAHTVKEKLPPTCIVQVNFLIFNATCTSNLSGTLTVPFHAGAIQPYSVSYDTTQPYSWHEKEHPVFVQIDDMIRLQSHIPGINCRVKQVWFTDANSENLARPYEEHIKDNRVSN